jgi:hypothetical protein
MVWLDEAKGVFGSKVLQNYDPCHAPDLTSSVFPTLKNRHSVILFLVPMKKCNSASIRLNVTSLYMWFINRIDKELERPYLAAGSGEGDL